MKRSRFKYFTKSLFASLLLMGLSANVAMAFGVFGTQQNARCAADKRVPAAPFNGANCDLCHTAGPMGGPGGGRTAFNKKNNSFFCQAAPMNTAPVANAGGPYAANTGVSIKFDGTGSSDADGDSLNYSWTFGDGSKASGVTPSHAYAAAGTYTVTLTVNDGTVSNSNTATAKITAPPPPPPVNTAPTADAGGPYAAKTGASISFDGTGSSDADGDALTYSWDFGDSMSGTGATPSHAYASAGTYTVKLTVSDGTDSASDMTTATITDATPPPPPPADNNAPVLGMIGNWMGTVGVEVVIPLSATDVDGDSLTFFADGLPADLMLNDNGDGTGSLSGTPTSAGSYDITVKVTDDGTPSLMDEELFTLTIKDEMTPPEQDVKIDSEAKWNSKRKVLFVKGEVQLENFDSSCTSDFLREKVTITNALGKKIIGTALNRNGKFKIREKLNMDDVSCYVTVSVAGSSVDVKVENSPADDCMDDEDEDEDEDEDDKKDKEDK